MEYVCVLYDESDITKIVTTYDDLIIGSTVTVPTRAEFDAAGYTPEGKYLKGFTAGETFIRPGATYTINKSDVGDATILFICPEYIDVPDSGYGRLISIEDYEESASLTRAFISGGSGLYAYGSGANFSSPSR